MRVLKGSIKKLGRVVGTHTPVSLLEVEAEALLSYPKGESFSHLLGKPSRWLTSGVRTVTSLSYHNLCQLITFY